MGKLTKLIFACGALIILTISLAIQQINYENAIAIKDEHIQQLQNTNDEIYQMYSDTLQELELLKSLDYEVYSKVRFTNYHVGDGSSTHRTGSKLTTYDFEINSQGWYTYDGKVVVATATWECINSDVGACKQYNSVPRGYNVYNYFDELEIVVNGKIYQAIVLDSCGGSYWNEKYQRIDIFISDESYYIDTIGYAK